MRDRLLTIAAAGLLVTATVTACSRPDEPETRAGTSTTTLGRGDGRARVGIILPDTTSAQRWSSDDPKYLKAAFAAQNVPVEVENARGNPADFVKIAQNMVDHGVQVLAVAAIDSESGRQALQAARAKSIPTIDYDRLTLNGGADYYVSFDNVKVGQLQALGLSRCLRERNRKTPVIAELNGSPDDNNATQFKSGYDEYLADWYDDGTFRKGPDQSVPDWQPVEAEKIFAQMLSQRPDIGGVLAANDGLAGALFRKERPRVPGKTKDPASGAYVPTVSIDPSAITVDTIDTVVEQNFASVRDICTPDYARLCHRYGLTE